METLNATLSFILNHLEGIAGFLSFMIAIKVWRESNIDKIKNSKEKQIEIYMDLYREWDNIFAQITAFPESNKILFSKSFNMIEDENIRFSIFNAINLLSRVHFYYQQTGQDLSTSNWKHTFDYVFSKNVFQTAFKKHSGRYNSEFQSYVKEVIENQKGAKVIYFSASKNRGMHEEGE